MKIHSLVLEITRRCNINCAHCLKGEKQNVAMSFEVIDAVFKKFTDITVLYISGGEITLAREEIAYIKKSILKNKVNIERFFYSINGRYLPDWFIDFSFWLKGYCNDSDFCFVAVSQDNFYPAYITRVKTMLNKYPDFFIIKDFPNENQTVLKMGKGKYFGNIPVVIFKPKYIKDRLSNIFLTVNVHGNIYPTCDLSYLMQDKKTSLLLGNILNSESLVKNIAEFSKLYESKIEVEEDKIVFY
jgi:hypothetical protein